MKGYCFILFCFTSAFPLVAQPVDSLVLKEVEVQATKTQPSVPFRITKPDRSCFRFLSGGTSLAEVLQTQTPVFIKSYGPGALATISFRGTGASHTQVYFNGMPINGITHGVTDFSLLPVWFTDEVEVRHGLASLPDGSGGLGGGVVLHNVPDTAEGMDIKGYYEHGAFGRNGAGAIYRRSNGKSGMKTRFYILDAKNRFPYGEDPATGEKQIRNHAYVYQWGLMQEVWKQKNPGKRWSLNISYIENYRRIPPTLLQDATRQFQEDKNLRLVNRFVNRKKNGYETWYTGWALGWLNYQDKNADLFSETQTLFFSQQWQPVWHWGKEQRLKGTVSANYHQARSDGFSSVAERFHFMALLQLEKRLLKRWETTWLIRQEHLDFALAPFVFSHGSRFQLSKKPEWYLKANAGRNFHAPNFNDLFWWPGGNSGLKPELGYTVEGGVQFENHINQHVITFEATAFQSWINNWILWAPNGSFWEANNLRKVNNRGWEGHFNWHYKSTRWHFSSAGNYTYTRSENIESAIPGDVTTGKQLLYVPVHNANGQASAGQRNWTATIGWSYTGKRYITTDNRTWLPGYALTDIGFQFHPHRKNKPLESIRFMVKNLFDVPYQAIAWRPMPGIHYQGVLKLNLIKKK